MRRRASLTFGVVCMVAFAASVAAAQDPVDVGPGIYEKIFENDRVRVLEVVFEPGEAIELHKHPDHLAYVIEGGKILIEPEGKPGQEHPAEPGAVLFIPAERHSAKNVGPTRLKILVVELKDPAPKRMDKEPAAPGEKKERGRKPA